MNVQRMKEEFRDETRKRLCDLFQGWILEWDDDEPHSLGNFYISADFHFIPAESCYEIHKLFERNKVIPKGTKHDHEHSCCYYYFKTRGLAELFCLNVASFLIKRLEIANAYNFLPDELTIKTIRKVLEDKNIRPYKVDLF